jgi:hypothetical protein
MDVTNGDVHNRRLGVKVNSALWMCCFFTATVVSVVHVLLLHCNSSERCACTAAPLHKQSGHMQR